jgi:signal recognition particle subunit SEC65
MAETNVVKLKKPTIAEMARALRKAGYRSRRFADEVTPLTRWAIGDGAPCARFRGGSGP